MARDFSSTLALAFRRRLAATVLTALALPVGAATITVDTAHDGASIPGTCSLRDAVRAANLDLAVQACAAGSGADVIRFAAGVDTIDLLDAGGGALIIQTPVILDGEGRRVTIRRPATQGPFKIIDANTLGQTLELRWITVTGGLDSVEGGGIRSRGWLTLSNSEVIGNATSRNLGGGGIYVYDGGTLTDSEVSGNSVDVPGSSGGGGGVATYGNLTVTRSRIADNAVSSLNSSGGGLEVQGNLTLVDSRIENNSVAAGGIGGGGVEVRGDLLARGSVISGNSANGIGGGIYCYGAVQLTGSTVFGNTNRADGAGIWARTASLSNSTVSGNLTETARTSGLYASGSGTAPEAFVVTLVNSTVAGNRSNADPLLHLRGIEIGTQGNGQLALHSSLVYGNSGTDVFSQNPLATSGSHNLVGSAENVTLPAGTLRCDPHLLPLASNGGLTPTHALAGDSCAIDAGNNTAALAFDQRGEGYPRVVGAAADIGAFELPDRIFADGFDDS